MLELDFEALRSVGLTTAVANRAAALDDGATARLLRVTEIHRDSVRVHDGVAERMAHLLARLARALDDDDALAVGDWVLGADDAQGKVWLRARVPPVSRLARRDEAGRRQAIVCNVDTALLVMGLDADFNPRRLERYLALVQAHGVTPVVVLTKADLLTEDACEARVETLRQRVPMPIDVLAVDATDAVTAQRLDPYLAAGQTLVLLGSSGAGKSTLTNTLLGVAVQSTGAVRASDGRGKHTTTSRSLFRLPQGACIIDTPGLRSLRPDVDETSLAASFEDIEALAVRCRFGDCRHAGEPGCAVRDGVDADRLANYQKLLRDAKRDTMTALERQRQRAVWKARGKSVRAYLKARGRE